MSSLKYRKNAMGVDGLKTGKEVIERALCLLGYAGVGSAGRLGPGAACAPRRRSARFTTI